MACQRKILFYIFSALFLLLELNGNAHAGNIKKCIQKNGSGVIFTDAQCPVGYEEYLIKRQADNDIYSSASVQTHNNAIYINSVFLDSIELSLINRNANQELMMNSIWENNSNDSLTLLFRVFLFGEKEEENFIVNRFFILKPKEKTKFDNVLASISNQSELKFRPVKANIVYFVKDEKHEKWKNDIPVK